MEYVSGSFSLPWMSRNYRHRELATRFTDTANYFVSEASVYRLLKAHDLIASPAYIVVKAADEFKDKTTAPNQLWQTDFTYFKVVGWGYYYLRPSWMTSPATSSPGSLHHDETHDVNDTLDLALPSGCDRARLLSSPRLLSDNGSAYISVGSG